MNMKLNKNPRARVNDWQQILKSIDHLRSKGESIQFACTLKGIAVSTYHEWKKRQQNIRSINGKYNQQSAKGQGLRSHSG